MKFIKKVILPLSLFALLPFSYALVNAETTTTNTTCSSNVVIDITSHASGDVMSGNESLKASSNTYVSGSRMKFALDGNIIAEASTISASDGSTMYTFRADIDTSTIPNGTYNLVARLYDSSGSFCQSPAVEVAVSNETTTQDEYKLVVRVNPEGSSKSEWYGPTNVSAKFIARSFLKNITQNTTKEVTGSTTFEWLPSIGKVSSIDDGKHNTQRFFSGSEPGEGRLNVEGQYSNLIAKGSSLLQIYEQDDSTVQNFPEETNTSETEQEEEDSEDESTSEEDKTNDLTAGNVALAKCLKERLGAERYESLTKEQLRLRFKELQDSISCFEQERYVVPANIAPVASDEIKNLKEDRNQLAVTRSYNVVSEENSSDTNLVFEGNAKPNSIVLVYIFSEPLVLSTETDGDGNWEYTLSDPLQPGSHEVYVVSEDDEGAFVRSPAFPVEIASAEATDSNPAGYSLVLAQEQEAEQNYFITAITVIIASLVAVVWMLAKRMSTKPEILDENLPHTESKKYLPPHD